MEDCHYHWGKERQNRLTCCGADKRPGGGSGGGGCSSATGHVWSGLPQTTGIIGPLMGYVKTKHRKTYPVNGNFGVSSLDCEMCYARLGLELVKVLNSICSLSTVSTCIAAGHCLWDRRQAGLRESGLP